MSVHPRRRPSSRLKRERRSLKLCGTAHPATSSRRGRTSTPWAPGPAWTSPPRCGPMALDTASPSTSSEMWPSECGAYGRRPRFPATCQDVASSPRPGRLWVAAAASWTSRPGGPRTSWPAWEVRPQRQAPAHRLHRGRTVASSPSRGSRRLGCARRFALALKVRRMQRTRTTRLT